MEKVIVITGPTAVGKTDISIELVKLFNGEIINCDASQFRKRLDIGTAKIDLSKVEVVHHLIDIIEPTESFSIKDYQVLARNKIDELLTKNVLPFLVGGSGLYINSVLGDYRLENSGRNPDFSNQYKNFSNEDLHKLLESLDYESSVKIHHNNRRRVLRALESSILGDKISEKQEGNNYRYDSLIICLICERERLYERINKRVDIMLDNGWLEEVISLRNEGIDLNSIKDIGYKELNQYLNNEFTLDETKEIIKQKTRNYAKRQITWFKNKMPCHFIEVDYNNILKTITKTKFLIEDFLNKGS